MVWAVALGGLAARRPGVRARLPRRVVRAGRPAAQCRQVFRSYVGTCTARRRPARPRPVSAAGASTCSRRPLCTRLPACSRVCSATPGGRCPACAPRTGAARAMLALGELAEELLQAGGRVRPWPVCRDRRPALNTRASGVAPRLQDLEHPRARAAGVNQEHQRVAGPRPVQCHQRRIDFRRTDRHG